MDKPPNFGQQVVSHGKMPSNRRVAAEIILLEVALFAFIALLIILQNNQQ